VTSPSRAALDLHPASVEAQAGDIGDEIEANSALDEAEQKALSAAR
jgi:hypothetical protein